jgi:hypothetical protein
MRLLRLGLIVLVATASHSRRCAVERRTPASWHGRRLLYSAGEGNTAVIDTREGRTIGPTSVVERIPGFSGDDSGNFHVAWR